jgi:hypothetical protein
MTRLLLAVCAVVLVLVPWRAAAQTPAHGNSPRVTITVNDPTLIGQTILKPGEYRFQCRHIDGKTFLVVTAAESGAEIVRVPCEEEALTGKVENSELRAIVGADGTRKLQSVRIKNETIAHRIVE